MCLGVPMKVVEVDPPVGELGGLRCKINLSLLDSVSVGDYVIVHAGLAISKINEKEAEEVFQYLRRVDELGELSS